MRNFFSPKKYVACLFALLLIVPLLAQTPPATQTANAKALFWKAALGTKTIYLFGSIHAADKSMYPMPPEVEHAFTASQALLVEADINKVDMMALVKTIQEKGMYPPEDGLSKHLDEKTMAALTEACKNLGVPPQSVERMRPWLVEITLSATAIQKAHLDVSLGIDKHFLDEAEKTKKEIIELESADFQINMMSGLPEDVLLKSLPKSLADLKDVLKTLEELKAAWLAGDAAKTADLMNQGMDEPAIRKAFLDDRNITMHQGILKASKDHDTIFVVVGAAHMVGDKGIVAQLKKDGYTIEQLNVTRPPATQQAPGSAGAPMDPQTTPAAH